jgi:hypothetical protein
METKSASGFDHMLIEGLSWGASYRTLDQAKAAMVWPFTSPNAWSIADVTYLVPVFNGGCPLQAEYLAALNYGLADLRLWAADQIQTMALAVSPMPVNQAAISS